MANHEIPRPGEILEDNGIESGVEGGPAPMEIVHKRHGSRPASPAEVEQFERLYGPFLSPDGEG